MSGIRSPEKKDRNSRGLSSRNGAVDAYNELTTFTNDPKFKDEKKLISDLLGRVTNYAEMMRKNGSPFRLESSITVSKAVQATARLLLNREESLNNLITACAEHIDQLILLTWINLVRAEVILSKIDDFTDTLTFAYEKNVPATFQDKDEEELVAEILNHVKNYIEINQKIGLPADLETSKCISQVIQAAVRLLLSYDRSLDKLIAACAKHIDEPILLSWINAAGADVILAKIDGFTDSLKFPYENFQDKDEEKLIDELLDCVANYSEIAQSINLTRLETSKNISQAIQAVARLLLSHDRSLDKLIAAFSPYINGETLAKWTDLAMTDTILAEINRPIKPEHQPFNAFE
jgi:hypothetical protein